MTPFRILSVAVAALHLTPSASAEFTSDLVPAFRGSPCARFDGFEVFTAPHASPNVPDLPGSAGMATITQLVPGAILTSAGNVYHPFAAPDFRLDAAYASGALEVVLQVAALGNPHDATSFALTHTAPDGTSIALAPSSSGVSISLPQVREELWLRWDLGATPAPVTAFAITWSASQANSSLDALLLDVRTECPPGAAACFGDGSGLSCPCGNAGATGRGCASSLNPEGAQLAAHGLASVGNDTLVLTGSGMPNSSALYFQGSSPTQVAFGDGLRCAGGTILRIGTRGNVAGASHVPGPGDPPVSVRGQVGAGDVRVYQAWYRNAADYCTSATFNLTNAYHVAWSG